MRPTLILFLGLVTIGCSQRDAEIRLRRRQVDRQTLRLQLDKLEDRMVANQARVRFWREMRARHQSVTAVACSNLESHAESMALLASRQAEQRAALSKRNRLAARWPSARSHP